MSRLYDNIEPSVIDDDMLHEAVEEQGPKEEAGKIAKQEGIDFGDVVSLRLDYKNILTIGNLWCFKKLTKLQLDNNIIEKMQGLDHLTNLVWLDLSFNNIEVIEGLETLTQLQDLTLYNNRVGVIENMSALVNLQVLSLGNNHLETLEDVMQLRQFKRLRTLNLSGNPFCEEERYKKYCIAFLPRLEYLDYRLIDEQTKRAAEQEYDVAIEEKYHDERLAEIKLEEAEEERTNLHLNMTAFVEGMNGAELYESLYADDSEGQKLNTMPGVDELLAQYKEKMGAICQQIFQCGITEHSRRDKEVREFWECVGEAKDENKSDAVRVIDTFLEYKKRLFQELQFDQDMSITDEKMAEYMSGVKEIWDKLMGLELQLVDQLEEAIKEFERNLADLVSIFVETVQGLFSQCRDLENQHHERLLEISIITLERAIKNELDDDVSEDLKLLMVDKDTVISAVTSSHDVHLLKIDNREDDIITRINQWMKGLIDGIHDEEEIKRNRARVAEIAHLVDHLREEIEGLDLGANY